MKKISILLCCIALLAGCSGKAQSTAKKTPGKQQSHSAANEQLQLKKWMLRSISQGDGSEQGFYRMKSIDNGDGNIYSNILYTDYESKKEVYLCDKPECKHNDDTCTSYFAGLDMVTQLIVHKDHVYLITNEDTTVNEKNERVTMPARILQMDLDGKNRRELCQMKSGYEFSYEDMAAAGNILYVPVEKKENVSTGSEQMSSVVQVVREKSLYAIQLDSGDYKAVADLKNKSILGTMGHDLVVNAYAYEENPEKLLDKGDFSGYERVSQNAKVSYERINADTGKVEKSIKADADLLGVYENGFVYYTDNSGMLKKLDMKTGKTDDLKQLDDPMSTLMYADEQHLFLYVKDKEYVYSLKDNLITPFTLKMRDTQEPIRLLGETKESYYVIYDQTGEVKRTWAGTDQYEASEYSYGLINKQDYWNSKADYIPVDVAVNGAQ